MPQQPASRPPICRRLLAVALTLLAVALALPRYATAEPGPAQPAQSPTLRPTLMIVPADDGQSIFVRAAGIGQLGGQVFTNLRLGPSGNKGSYTMVYSATTALYEVVVPGFSATQSAIATLSISTTAGLQSADLPLARGYLPAGQLGAVSTADGRLTLQVLSGATLPGSPYVVASASPGPPGPPPAGLTIVGYSYSLRASGSILESDRPMTLRLSYSPSELGASDPQRLAIYAWDEPSQVWIALPSTVFADQGYVSTSASRFTFYALLREQPAGRERRTFLPLINNR